MEINTARTLSAQKRMITKKAIALRKMASLGQHEMHLPAYPGNRCQKHPHIWGTLGQSPGMKRRIQMDQEVKPAQVSRIDR
jgi:hypothetical protein